MAIAPASQLRYVDINDFTVTSPTGGDTWTLYADWYLTTYAKIGSSSSKPEEGWHHCTVTWMGTFTGVNYTEWNSKGLVSTEVRIQTETITWEEAQKFGDQFRFHSECSPPDGYDNVRCIVAVYDQYNKSTSPGYQMSKNNPTVVWQATHYETDYSREFTRAEWERRTPSAPEGPPNVEILSDGVTVRLSYSNLTRVDKVRFDAYYKDYNVHTFEKKNAGTAKVTYGMATCDIKLIAGRKYAFRAYNITTESGVDYTSDPSDYTDWYQTAPIEYSISLFEVLPVSTTEVQARWNNSSLVSFDGVQIQYARTQAELEAESGSTFHEGDYEIFTDVHDINRVRISSLTSGTIWYFRIRPYVNGTSSGKLYGPWYKASHTNVKTYDYVRVPLGTVPAAPTTWSLITTYGYVKEYDKGFYLYAIHNSEDGSACRTFQVQIQLISKNGSEIFSYQETVENRKDEFGEYVKDNLEYFVEPYADWRSTLSPMEIDMSELRWSIRTKGALDTYGPWSIVRTIKIYIQPEVQVTMAWSAGGGFPMNVEGTLIAQSQNALQFYFELISRSNYEVSGPLGERRFVTAGEVLYSKLMGPTSTGTIKRDADFIIGPTEISTLLSNAAYQFRCVCYTDAGLSCSDTYDFRYTPTALRSYYPAIAAYEVDEKDRSIYLLPKCFTDKTYTTPMDSNLTYLAVYRYNHDGTYTLVEGDITGATNVWIHDPHPRLDKQIYRVVSTGKVDGIVQYTQNDITIEAFEQRGLVIQWDERFDRQNMYYQSNLTWIERFAGKFLYLPFNVDVSESVTVDKTLVNYIGRENPVSYYGTSKTKELTIKTEIPKNKVVGFDTEGTLLLLRQLSRYTGDVYVRTFTGISCWGTVDIDYDINHCELTVPINIKVTPVEGGA